MIAGATLAYVTQVPPDKPCDDAEEDGVKIYVCDGIVYRPTYYQDERVYEILSDDDGGRP